MIEFRMPSLGADMEAGTLIEWLKSPGDVLQRGDVIAVVETQKGAIEIEVFQNGTLESFVAMPGDEVPVGHVLARIRTPDDAREIEAAAPPLIPIQAPAEPPMPVPGLPIARRLQDSRVRITPAARRQAQIRGIDLSLLRPGKDGIIGLREVDSTAQPSPVKRRGTIDAAEMRKAIGAAMARSNREIPHYYVTSMMDMTPLMSWLAACNAARPVEKRLLYAAPLIRAAALALKKHPEFNGHYENGVFAPASEVNMGIAIAVRGGGLVTPAILSTDGLDVDTVMRRLSDLVQRVRAGGLRSSELSMGTVTLTNLGEKTADALMPIIYPPQVAIVACGQIAERPWIFEGEVTPRQIMSVTISGDHRVSDGRSGAQFLDTLAKLLADPEAL